MRIFIFISNRILSISNRYWIESYHFLYRFFHLAIPALIIYQTGQLKVEISAQTILRSHPVRYCTHCTHTHFHSLLDIQANTETFFLIVILAFHSSRNFYLFLFTLQSRHKRKHFFSFTLAPSHTYTRPCTHSHTQDVNLFL